MTANLTDSAATTWSRPSAEHNNITKYKKKSHSLNETSLKLVLKYKQMGVGHS